MKSSQIHDRKEKMAIDSLCSDYNLEDRHFELEGGSVIGIYLHCKSLDTVPEQITDFTNLQWLSIARNRISKIKNLENLKKLEILNIYSNKINKLENLNCLSNLETLIIANNKIEKIENLDNLTNLKELDLSHNQIKKIEGLENLCDLGVLYLTHNLITEIEGLERLKNLGTLYLNDNLIRKNYDFTKLPNLKTIYLWNNYVYDIYICSECGKSVLDNENFQFCVNFKSFFHKKCQSLHIKNKHPIYTEIGLKNIDLISSKIPPICNKCDRKFTEQDDSILFCNYCKVYFHKGCKKMHSYVHDIISPAYTPIDVEVNFRHGKVDVPLGRPYL